MLGPESGYAAMWDSDKFRCYPTGNHQNIIRKNYQIDVAVFEASIYTVYPNKVSVKGK